MMAANIITQAELKELLHYDPLTGVFTNACQRGTRGASGAVTGSVDRKGYVLIRVKSKSYFAHRLAWLYTHGVFLVADTDHIDRCPTNNRIANLRPATRSENCQNTKIHKDNTSGYKGVGWHKQQAKWQAQIMINGKRSRIGLFTNLADAAAAYAAAAVRLHPYRPA
jgi:hypothetical protein